MKKKQKQKLLNQFRPSLDVTRSQLFQSMEKESIRRYGLPLEIMMDPKNRRQLIVGLAGKSNEDTRIEIPIDNSFATILKRIRSGEEDGLFDSFRDNFLMEIVNYWNDQRMANRPAQEATEVEPTTATVEETTSPASEEPAKAPAEEQTEAKTPAKDTAMDLAAFKKAVSDYPKFVVETTENAVIVQEESPKGPRKLAEISMKNENEFSIEKALERKYKVKLTFVPLIEAFAATPISER